VVEVAAVASWLKGEKHAETGKSSHGGHRGQMGLVVESRRSGAVAEGRETRRNGEIIARRSPGIRPSEK
jgi:hypothetical protein